MSKVTTRFRVLAIAATIAGASLIGAVVFNSVVAESLASANQIRIAEQVPLVQAASGVSNTNLKTTKLKEGTVFAKIYVPRYGKNYVHLVAEGTSLKKVLNKVGIGRYLATQMPGEVGNFAIAGHRFGNGGPMLKIDKLKAGDKVYVKTATTWYTYVWLQTKVVKPSAIGTIDRVPEGLKYPIESGKYLTFTSCTPIHVNTMRIVAWFGYESEQPVDDGMPTDLAAVYTGK